MLWSSKTGEVEGEGRVYNHSVIANKLENFATLVYETSESDDKTTKK